MNDIKTLLKILIIVALTLCLTSDSQQESKPPDKVL